MRFLFAIVGLVAISAPAHAESWRSVNEYDGYPAVITYVDTDSISRSGDNMELVYREYIEGEYGDASNNFVQRRSLNCAANTYYILSHQAYNGSVQQGAPTQDLSTRTVAAGSADQRLQDAVCGKTSYLTGPISDPVYDAEEFFYSLDDY